ncbi:MAG: LysR family transcriptional regulator [Lachnospiraceae bacterium]|nr:LysR family transcriptional regulator [Lachnospiraceae bacterium]
MDFAELRYFLAIVEHKNLTKAAQELYISQPTLTKYLQRLEKELGGKVFRKNGHRYELTFLGQRYLEYAQKVIQLNQDWEKELSDMRSSYSGELNIAIPHMRSASLIPQLLPDYHRKQPGIHINFYEYGAFIQDKLVSDANLDFAILSDWKAHPSLEYEHLKTEEILLVLPENHPAARQAVRREDCHYPWLDLRCLSDCPFILHFPDQNTGRAARQLFDQYHIQPPVPFRSRNSQTCIQLSFQGLGASFAPESYVKHASAMWPVQAFSVGEPPIQNHLVLAYRKNAYLSTFALDFIATAKECLE